MTLPQAVSCPVCGQPMALRPAQGRKSGKAFLMLLCAVNGRHFRGFINDQEYMGQVLARLQAVGGRVPQRDEAKGQGTQERGSGADLERGSGP